MQRSNADTVDYVYLHARAYLSRLERALLQGQDIAVVVVLEETTAAALIVGATARRERIAYCRADMAMSLSLKYDENQFRESRLDAAIRPENSKQNLLHHRVSSIIHSTMEKNYNFKLNYICARRS